MSRYRGTVLILLLCASLSFISCAKHPHVAPASAPVPPAPSSAATPEYPNTTEGLRSLVNDMLTATKRSDSQRVDALMKRTEFPDYAQYFVGTFSPDSLAAEDWAITYTRWLSENEDHLRELLGTLAKDEDGSIIVSKANDNPVPGRGFEWGMLHYARVPIDVYRVTLVFHSPDSPGESVGYFVYSSGTFRWDSIVPFAAPGTYQSDPGTSNLSQMQGEASRPYPNTADGLREFLSELRAAAGSGDRARVDSMIKQTEIPEYRNWFCSVYIPGSGLSWAIPYGKNLAENEQSFKALWEKLAQDDGEIRVRKLVDKRGSNRDMEWGMIHNSRTPLDIYHAAWKSGKGTPDEWIGYFIYIDGMFRLNSTGRRVSVVRTSPSANR